MLFYQLGEMLQGTADERSRRSIAELMNIRPDYANVPKTAAGIRQVSPEQIRIGGSKSTFVPGKRSLWYGIVVEGSSMLDTSALDRGIGATGSEGRAREVLAGFV